MRKTKVSSRENLVPNSRRDHVQMYTRTGRALASNQIEDFDETNDRVLEKKNKSRSSKFSWFDRLLFSTLDNSCAVIKNKATATKIINTTRAIKCPNYYAVNRLVSSCKNGSANLLIGITRPFNQRFFNSSEFTRRFGLSNDCVTYLSCFLKTS